MGLSLYSTPNSFTVRFLRYDHNSRFTSFLVVLERHTNTCGYLIGFGLWFVFISIFLAAAAVASVVVVVKLHIWPAHLTHFNPATWLPMCVCVYLPGCQLCCDQCVFLIPLPLPRMTVILIEMRNLFWPDSTFSILLPRLLHLGEETLQ